ncbi:MAG: arginase family protein [Candidatus Aenigmarchaeota archaeon]|nr:arginase family protein [Candidatus Aenigmarchaeota archaeon]
MPDFRGRLTDGKIFGTFLDNDSNPPLEKSDAGILGVAFDATASYRKGASLGPHAIMQASHQIEYPPTGHMEKLSEMVRMHFAGILEYQDFERHEDIDASSKAMVGDVSSLSGKMLAQKKLLAVFGGEHSILNGPLKAIWGIQSPRDVTVLQIDAHLDMRESFDGLEYSHGSVMRNCIEAGFKTVHVGIRDQISGKRDSGGEAEYILEKGLGDRIFFCATQPKAFYMRNTGLKKAGIDPGNLIFNGMLDEKMLSKIGDLVKTKYLWLTIDVDGFDPSVFPGTGTPLPHGLQLSGVESLIYGLLKSRKAKLLGFDIVEVMPQMQSNAKEYEVQNTVSTITEMNAALLAYKIFFWNFMGKGK